MRRYLLLFSLFYSGICVTQNAKSKIWLETGVSYELSKALDATLDQTMRFGNTGLETYFPQLSVRYNWRKWLKPSVDYRIIFDKDRFGNFSSSSRLNVNTDIKGSIKRFSTGIRLRYQYSFSAVPQKKYDAEFDQAVRVKLYAKYAIKKSAFTPLVSAEWFYNPNYASNGYSFTKERFFVGSQINLKGPHDFAIGYIFDRELNTVKPGIRHITNFSYTYSLRSNKKDDREQQSTGGDLFNE